MTRCLLAVLGGVPKAAPPQVIAGTMPALTSAKPLLFLAINCLVLLALAVDAVILLFAWVAILLRPDPTGVRKSVTDPLAVTSMPLLARHFTAIWAALGLFARELFDDIAEDYE